MFLGGAGFHDGGGRTRAPSWCKVMRSDMEVLICIRVRTCQTWESLVFSLVQHAITDHSEALFTHCSRTLVLIIWPIALDMILNSIIHLLGFKISHWWLWRLLIFWVIMQCSRVKVNRHFGGTCQGRRACCMLHAGFLLSYSLTLTMDAISSSETSVGVHWTSPQYISENRTKKFYISAFSIEMFHIYLCLRSHEPGYRWLIVKFSFAN
jgi:hypothetical protein